MLNWQKIPKIDAHIHLTPDDVIKANQGYDGCFIKYGSLNDYTRSMEEYNIRKAIIMPFNDPYMLSMEFTLEAVHRNLAEMTEGHEGRFLCCADLDLRRDLAENLAELDRVSANERFVGIKIHPSNTGYPVDGIFYQAIFEYAEKKNLLIEIHSYPRENLTDDVCSPSRIKKMLKKYPRARVSIAHMGGFQYEDLIKENVYFNISAILTDWVERLGIAETNKILRRFGVDKLVFASDFPDNRGLEADQIYDRYFEILAQCDFSADEAEKICMHNALKMLEAE